MQGVFVVSRDKVDFPRSFQGVADRKLGSCRNTSPIRNVWYFLSCTAVATQVDRGVRPQDIAMVREQAVDSLPIARCGAVALILVSIEIRKAIPPFSRGRQATTGSEIHHEQ